MTATALEHGTKCDAHHIRTRRGASGPSRRPTLSMWTAVVRTWC